MGAEKAPFFLLGRKVSFIFCGFRVFFKIAAPPQVFGTNIAAIMSIGFGLIRKELYHIQNKKLNKGIRSWQ